jgi:hypothetical protein
MLYRTSFIGLVFLSAIWLIISLDDGAGVPKYVHEGSNLMILFSTHDAFIGKYNYTCSII